jgi:hypothetical protein
MGLKLRIVVIVMALAIAVSSLAAGSAFAKGAKGSDPSLTLSPNPATTNGLVQVFGCSYSTSTGVVLDVVHPSGYTEKWGIEVWYSGCLVNQAFPVAEAGTYTIQAYQDLKGNRLTLETSTTLTVRKRACRETRPTGGGGWPTPFVAGIPPGAPSGYASTDRRRMAARSLTRRETSIPRESGARRYP